MFGIFKKAGLEHPIETIECRRIDRDIDRINRRLDNEFLTAEDLNADYEFVEMNDISDLISRDEINEIMEIYMEKIDDHIEDTVAECLKNISISTACGVLMVSIITKFKFNK